MAIMTITFPDENSEVIMERVNKFSKVSELGFKPRTLESTF